ncbi:MAG: peptidoglycan DD-metalloendopeptidase family protein, partial [Clostridiales bacterium]|nr:peptidoglycan DD-metalloendopeptidase family protein [Clostridiales bacterium]
QKQKAEGSFGGTTKDAVKAFQKAHGLTANGVVNEATWKAIQSEYYQTATYTDQSVTMRGPFADFLANRGDPYGYRIINKGTANHQGQDFKSGGVSNIPILATISGTVVSANYMGARGNTVIIQSSQNPNVYVVLQHLASMNVVPGMSVGAGEQVGIMGDTGVGTGVHLHMEVLIDPPFNEDKTSVTSLGYSMNP